MTVTDCPSVAAGQSVCDSLAECNGFSRCGNTCHMKSKYFSGSEPSHSNNFCSFHFVHAPRSKLMDTCVYQNNPLHVERNAPFFHGGLAKAREIGIQGEFAPSGEESIMPELGLMLMEACGAIAEPRAQAACTVGGFILMTIPVDTWIRDAIRNTQNDNAVISVKAGQADEGGGDAIHVRFHLFGGGTDDKNMGQIERAETIKKTEDLDNDSGDVEFVELRLDSDTNDVCMEEVVFAINHGKTDSNLEEQFEFSAPLLNAIFGGRAAFDSDHACLWFGDEEGSLSNFKFSWPGLRSCTKDLETYEGDCMVWPSFVKCFREQALERFDVVVRRGVFNRCSVVDGKDDCNAVN